MTPDAPQTPAQPSVPVVPPAASTSATPTPSAPLVPDSTGGGSGEQTGTLAATGTASTVVLALGAGALFLAGIIMMTMHVLAARRPTRGNRP